ncbi:hypothetical protein T484DRAFT_2718384 [Baffinella frigidus]|nr:hypothetical protein T484DRAFT_2718384 [Cryptophyta sp. CCMP2293]
MDDMHTNGPPPATHPSPDAGHQTLHWGGICVHIVHLSPQRRKGRLKCDSGLLNQRLAGQPANQRQPPASLSLERQGFRRFVAVPPPSQEQRAGEAEAALCAVPPSLASVGGAASTRDRSGTVCCAAQPGKFTDSDAFVKEKWLQAPYEFCMGHDHGHDLEVD